MEEKIKIKKTTLWQIATGVLAVLLIISILTNGFSSGTPSGSAVSGSAGKITVIALNDERCAECDISGLIAQLSQVLPGLDVEEIDYSSEEGKRLYEETDVGNLPALLFKEDVKDQEGYANLANFMEEKGDYLSLKIGASFDPTKEICDNEVDDNKDGKVDCDDADCSNKLICNKDALVECVEPYGLTADTVIFLYSNSCPWCQKMKPVVQALDEEGYNVHQAEGSDAESMEVVDSCFSDYMTSQGVPQFMCVQTGEIKVGAFTDADGNTDEEAVKNWFDNCVNS